MRKRWLAVLAVALALAAPTLASAHGWRHGYGHGPWVHRPWHHRHWHHGYGSRVIVGVGAPFYGWGPYGHRWGYRGWWGPGPVVVRERTIVREEPVYVERDAVPAPAPEPAGTWYFCRSRDAYYPDVERCPEAWIPVPARGR
jgi:hypothetical protein